MDRDSCEPIPSQEKYFNTTTRSNGWSEWASKPITIDGVPDEWTPDYMAIPVGVAGDNVDLYLANDDTYLYICVDAISDNTDEESADDAVLLLFDGDNSNNASKRTSAPYSPEDLVGNNDNWVTICGDNSSKSTPGTAAENCHNDAGYILEYEDNDTLLLVHNNNNWMDEWSYQWNVSLNGSPERMVYEMRIPLAQWGWTPGDTIGGTLAVLKDGNNTPIGIWPSDLQAGEINDPGEWSDFILGTPNEKPTITRATAEPSPVENDGKTAVLFTVKAGDVDGSLSEVTIDLEEIQQNGNVEMVDDGTGGDEVSGDGTYSYNTTISSSIPPGKYDLPVTVIDNHTPNVGFAADIIELEVVQSNREPRLILMNETDISGLNRIELTAYEDVDNTFVFTAEDDDDDILMYSINIGEVFLDLVKGVDYQFDPATGKLDLRPKQENVGSHGLTLEVIDGRDGSDSIDITLYIENSNDVPQLSDIKTQLVFQDAWLNLTPVATDEDEDSFTFSTNFTELFEGNISRDHFQFQNDTGEFRFKPDKSMVKKYHTYIHVEDPTGAFSREDFIIDVININDPPEPSSFNYTVENFNPAVTFTTNEGTDPDNDPITYTWNFGDGTENQSGEALLDVLHSYESEGVFTVNLTLSDNQGFSTQSSRKITVTLPQLKGAVMETNKRGISGSDVGVTRVDRVREVLNYTTGTNGNYEISLAAGTYDLTIRKEGFITEKTQLNITSGILYRNFTLKNIPAPDIEPVPSTDTSESGGWVYCLLGVGAILFGCAVVIMIVMRRKKKKETPEPKTEIPFGMRQQNQRVFPTPPTHAPTPQSYSPRPPWGVTNPPTNIEPTAVRTEQAPVQEKTKKPHKKPTIVAEIWPEKKETETKPGTELGTEPELGIEPEKKVDVIRVTRKKRDDDIQEIFGGPSDINALPAVGETTRETTQETAQEMTQETSEPRPPRSSDPEFTDSLKNMAEILKSFSKRGD